MLCLWLPWGWTEHPLVVESSLHKVVFSSLAEMVAYRAREFPELLVGGLMHLGECWTIGGLPAKVGSS